VLVTKNVMALGPDCIVVQPVRATMPTTTTQVNFATIFIFVS
jgi:hypothetical protein